jgi:hypothetical protein
MLILVVLVSCCHFCRTLSLPPVFMLVLVRTDGVSLMLMVVPAIIPASFPSRLDPVHAPCLFPRSVLLACALFWSWPILTHLPALGYPGPGPDSCTLVRVCPFLLALVTVP